MKNSHPNPMFLFHPGKKKFKKYVQKFFWTQASIKLKKVRKTFPQLFRGGKEILKSRMRIFPQSFPTYSTINSSFSIGTGTTPNIKTWRQIWLKNLVWHSHHHHMLKLETKATARALSRVHEIHFYFFCKINNKLLDYICYLIEW
jgi:hypothetical protein